MMAFVALITLPLAFLFQALGYTGTCTQGDDGPFLTGVVFSSPFLFACIVSLAVSQRRMVRHLRLKGSALVGTASLVVLLLAIWMLYANSKVAYYTLWLGIGPCGPDYHHSIEGLFNGKSLTVGLVYAIAPAVIAGLAMLTLWVALPSRTLDGRNV